MLWTLKKCWYYVFQFFFTRIQYLLPWRRPELLEGPGSIKKLPELIQSKGVQKVLVVTDRTLSKLGLPNVLYEALTARGVAYAVFDDVGPNPSIESVEAARAAYLAGQCQGIVAIGGGSAIDCAKAAGARLVRPKRSVQQLGGTLRVLHKLPPFFAVPTTAGTGSETTIAAVVTDYATHHKFAVQDICLIPRYAVLDPELTRGLPPQITSTTGMDALTHAVEAYTNRYTPKYAAKYAKDAVKLVFSNLETAYRDGGNLTARHNMQLASFYGGAAFTRACVGYVHAIAHTLGGLYGMPHGLANAIILPYVMEDFGAVVYKPLSELAVLVGLPGETAEARAKNFILEIRRMNRDMKIPDKIDCIRDEDVPQIIRWAMKEANPIYPCPVIWGEKELLHTIAHIRA